MNGIETAGLKAAQKEIHVERATYCTDRHLPEPSIFSVCKPIGLNKTISVSHMVLIELASLI